MDRYGPLVVIILVNDGKDAAVCHFFARYAEGDREEGDHLSTSIAQPRPRISRHTTVATIMIGLSSNSGFQSSHTLKSSVISPQGPHF